jgi:hypothetical protein
MGKALSSEFTSVLAENDSARDNSFIGLRNYVNSFVHSKDGAKAAAALKLSDMIQSVGNGIYRLGYLDETAKLNSLITNLRTSEATQALETIGAVEWFTALETDQQVFEQAYQSKVDTESAINYPLLKASKAMLINLLRALLIYIESNVDLDAGKFAPVEQKLNEIITDITAISRARLTRAANEKKKNEEPKTV